MENKMVADRLIELWPEIRKIVEFWNRLPKSGRPASNAVARYNESHSEIICVWKFRVQLNRSWFVIHDEVSNLHDWILCYHEPFHDNVKSNIDQHQMQLQDTMIVTVKTSVSESSGFDLTGRDSWFTTRFWISTTEFFVIMTLFTTM